MAGEAEEKGVVNRTSEQVPAADDKKGIFVTPEKLVELGYLAGRQSKKDQEAGIPVLIDIIEQLQILNRSILEFVNLCKSIAQKNATEKS
jgi:hypothetical protein